MSNRRKPPAPAASASAPAAKTRPWQALIGEVMLERARMVMDGRLPRREFLAPVLPPGVVPKGARFALDSANANAGYAWLNGQQGFCGMAFPGYTYLAELSQRSEYREPSGVIANEMTREWIKFNGVKGTKLKELEEAFKEFDVRNAFRTCTLYDGFFGLGHLFIRIKGQEGDRQRMLPLIVDNEGATIRKGSLLGLKPIEPLWTTPYAYNSINPTLPNFYRPDFWYVLGKQTHSSRMLQFVSRPVPDILKPSYNFGGMSLSQLIEPYVARWLKTVDSINRLLSNFSITALATNMGATLEDGGDSNSILRRAQLFNLTRDNRGLMLLDKESEDLVQKNTPLSGLSDLQAQAQEHMAAPTHIPLVKLTGHTPAGLNASDDGQIKVFYDWIGSEQENQYQQPLDAVLKIIQLHLWGKVDPNIKAEFVPLDSPTDAELAEMTSKKSKAGLDYVTGGVIDANEERERLRNDPHSGYTFIKGDAPAAPLEQEADLEEEKAQADHERSEESAAKAHERQKELDKGKPKK